MSKAKGYSDTEKALVDYLKQMLIARGVKKFPRDWHLKQLSVSKNMLSGDNAPTFDEWKACINWCLADRFWCDKVDHLAAVERLWTKYSLQTNRSKNGAVLTETEADRKRLKEELINSLYMR